MYSDRLISIQVVSGYITAVMIWREAEGWWVPAFVWVVTCLLGLILTLGFTKLVVVMFDQQQRILDWLHDEDLSVLFLCVVPTIVSAFATRFLAHWWRFRKRRLLDADSH